MCACDRMHAHVFRWTMSFGACHDGGCGGVRLSSAQVHDKSVLATILPKMSCEQVCRAAMFMSGASNGKFADVESSFADLMLLAQLHNALQSPANWNRIAASMLQARDKHTLSVRNIHEACENARDFSVRAFGSVCVWVAG